MNKLITALLLTLLIPATSFAGFEDGNNLLADCESEKSLDFWGCLGYIEGVADTHKALVIWNKMEPIFCIPRNASVDQLKKIVVKHLNENLKHLHLVVSGAVLNALHFAFPPSKKDDGTSYCPDEGES